MYRQKLFAFINLFGLSVAMATVILIYLWINHELSYDQFHKDYENIFRVEENQFYNNERYHVNVTPWPSGPVWENQIPEIEISARYTYAGSMLFRYADSKYYESGVIAADSGFFRIFSFQFKYGEADDALKSPGSIVLGEELSIKYFGDENPVGKIITINNSKEYIVTGVISKIPSNSSIRFQAAISFNYMKDIGRYSESWGNNSIFTYVKLVKNAGTSDVDRKLTEVVNLNKEDNDVEFLTAPIKKLHLYSYFGYGVQQRGIQNIYIFSAVALFILIIACINFMNLTTAKVSTRSKEIGVRKVTGALRSNLITQFLGESMVMTFFSFIVSVIIVLFLIPTFNLITGKEFSTSDLFDPNFILAALIILILTGILSGTYPSFYLSSLLPEKILKSQTNPKTGKAFFRKITVVIQFSLTIILIISTTIIYRQLNYMQSKSLGYEKENLLYIPLRGDLRNSYEILKMELKKLPSVSNVSASMHTPHHVGSNSGGVDWEGKDPELELLVSTAAADYDFVETMQIRMKNGRSFSKDFGSDAVHDSLASFLINEEMERIMDTENAVGKQFHFMGFHGPVIGVMKDYHYQSARNFIEPIAMVVAPKEFLNFMIIRIASGDIKSHIKSLNQKWDEIMPQYPFDYRFVDEEFDRMYRAEERMGRLMSYLCLVAIIIAAVGLFGLSAFSAEQRTKEIGIRKVFGSSIRSLLGLLSKEIILLLGVSMIISWPASYYILKSWLQNFDYRANLSLWIFLSAGVLTLLIALISVSYQTLKAANRNPATSLRYE